MTQWTTGHNSPTLFTDAQWRVLRALQARYLQGLHLFSERETARLEFLRWLRQNASFGEAGFENPAATGQDARVARCADAAASKIATRDRPKRPRFLTGGDYDAANTSRSSQESAMDQSGQGMERTGEQQ